MINDRDHRVPILLCIITNPSHKYSCNRWYVCLSIFFCELLSDPKSIKIVHKNMLFKHVLLNSTKLNDFIYYITIVSVGICLPMDMPPRCVQGDHQHEGILCSLYGCSIN